MNRIPIEVGEWYHCYNRGVDKRDVYMMDRDFERFLMLTYLANSHERVRIGKYLQGFTLQDALKNEREGVLVEIGAYALMNNHFHLLLKEVAAGGISEFMQRLTTGYTMYFNKKHQRSGALFQGAFRSKHVQDDRYFKRVLNYIHANPAEKVEPEWKKGIVRDEKKVTDFLETYPYSSLADYTRECRPQSAILSMDAVRELYEDISEMSTQQILEEARIFAHETADEFE